ARTRAKRSVLYVLSPHPILRPPTFRFHDANSEPQPIEINANEGPDDPTPPLPNGPRYGTVGTWPAFSWASRAALSPASWVGSSFGTNLPELALGDVAAAAVLEVAALAASGPASAAPITPPVNSDPATAAPTNI